MQDDRQVAAVRARRSISPSSQSTNAAGSTGSAEPFICFAGRGERRQHAARVDVAPLEGQQGEAGLDTGAAARRGAVAQPGLAQDLDAAVTELPPGGRRPAIRRPSRSKAVDAAGQVLGLLGRRQLAPLLVAPGVVGHLVATGVDLAQQVGIQLGVEALDEEGRRRPRAARAVRAASGSTSVAVGC